MIQKVFYNHPKPDASKEVNASSQKGMLGSVLLVSKVPLDSCFIIFRLNQESKGMMQEMPDGYFEWAALSEQEENAA